MPASLGVRPCADGGRSSDFGGFELPFAFSPPGKEIKTMSSSDSLPLKPARQY